MGMHGKPTCPGALGLMPGDREFLNSPMATKGPPLPIILLGQGDRNTNGCAGRGGGEVDLAGLVLP